MKATLLDLSTGMNSRQRITLEIAGDFRNEYNRLKSDAVNVEIRKFRSKRSLDANAYAWVLIDRIAEALMLDKVSVYKDAIRNIGGVSDVVCIPEQAAERLRTTWESKGIGWQTEEMPSKLEGCVNVVLYYGSSTYDSKQMSALIEQLILEAKNLGIPTDTPEQIARYLYEGGDN